MTREQERQEQQAKQWEDLGRRAKRLGETLEEARARVERFSASLKRLEVPEDDEESNALPEPVE